MVRLGKNIAYGVMVLLVGVVIGANIRFFDGLQFSTGLHIHTFAKEEIRKTPDGDSHFTSPLLECTEMPESLRDAALDSAKLGVEKIISTYKSSKNITEVSVYFRDLNNGPWFGINEGVNYFPASLLKLPLAMSFYDDAEDDPNLLSKEVVYKADPSITTQLQPFGAQAELVDGKKYTVQYLLDLMLKESNNEAANSLAMFGGQDVISNVYHDLGLKIPEMGKDYSISTHRYASFFRILYNATYVDRVASERILKTLSEAAFTEGLVAGVPKG